MLTSIFAGITCPSPPRDEDGLWRNNGKGGGAGTKAQALCLPWGTDTAHSRNFWTRLGLQSRRVSGRHCSSRLWKVPLFMYGSALPCDFHNQISEIQTIQWIFMINFFNKTILQNMWIHLILFYMQGHVFVSKSLCQMISVLIFISIFSILIITL